MGVRARFPAARQQLGYLSENFGAYWREAANGAPGMGTIERTRHILRGFHPLEACWYQQVRQSTKGCISNLDRQRKLNRLNGSHGYLLGNKLVFAHVLRSVGVPHPQVFGSSHDGRWSWIEDGHETALAVQASGEAVVVKPIDGRKGQAIEFVRDAAVLAAPRRYPAMATRFVQQAGYAAAIFPGSLNTIRVLTLIGRDGSAMMAAAVHRFGGNATNGVDNFSAGGIVARVDLDTGRLERAVRIGAGNRLIWLDRHPDTASRIEGTVVPHWQAVQALALRLCALFPYLRYVGWDIAVTDDGPVVIEGNAQPSLRFFQLYEPLLENPRVRGFFLEAMGEPD